MQLYGDSGGETTRSQGEAFIEGISLPSVTQDQRDFSNADIQEEDVGRVISGLATSKAPGPDGFTGEFFKLLKKQISLVLATCYTNILHGEQIRPESKNVCIKLIPKPGKDQLDPGSQKLWLID